MLECDLRLILRYLNCSQIFLAVGHGDAGKLLSERWGFSVIYMVAKGQQLVYWKTYLGIFLTANSNPNLSLMMIDTRTY